MLLFFLIILNYKKAAGIAAAAINFCYIKSAISCPASDVVTAFWSS